MEWKDRVPTKPNRKKITFEDDASVRFAKIEYADEPTEEGTSLSAASFKALADDARPVTGTYTAQATSVTVNLGFRPRALIIQPIGQNSNYFAGSNNLIPLAFSDSLSGTIIFTDTGFTVFDKDIRIFSSSATVNLNKSSLNYNEKYVYLAWR